ncbi:4Fe-4S ferredoxin [Halorhodospira abdelmalekii]|uniref:sulfate reduction electron transfer complex DsrMKJOP subunit DsrO n=1 Tax=Halorhodospira abdelmalekii TaxID=421629 RepID=UPI00190527F1|nr:4Fe-4S ferredoxin [Halorhodospira abdelmalekii]
MSEDASATRTLSRRRFLGRCLGAGTAAAGLLLAPGVWLLHGGGAAAAAADGEPGPDRTRSSPRSPRWGLLIDTQRCSAECSACIDACQEENGWPEPEHPQQDPQWIRKVTVRGPGDSERSLPMLCQHCQNPPCASVCPTRATFRRADGIVLVDKHRCIGCRYCMIACPFQVRFMPQRPVAEASPNHPRGKGAAEGCTLCVHRVDRGQQPACVERCAADGHGALLFGDLNDPGSALSEALRDYGGAPLRSDLGLAARVHYRGLS